MNTHTLWQPLFPVVDERIVESVLHDSEARRIFLRIALLEELIKFPNPLIRNLIVFIKGYEDIFRANEENQNNLIQNMEFDREGFSDFFPSLYDQDMYGKGFLENPEKKETIFWILNGDTRVRLGLIDKLGDILEMHALGEYYKKWLTGSSGVARDFFEFTDNMQVHDRIYDRLLVYRDVLREDLQERLLQRVPELRGIVQEEVGRVVAKEKGKS